MLHGALQTFSLIFDERRLVLHHGVDGQLLVVLGRDDGDGGALALLHDRHVLHLLHLCTSTSNSMSCIVSEHVGMILIGVLHKSIMQIDWSVLDA